MDDTNRQHGDYSTGGNAVRRVGPVLLTLRDLRRQKADDTPGRHQVAGTKTDLSGTVVSAQRVSDPPVASAALASAAPTVESPPARTDQVRRKSSFRTGGSSSDKRMSERLHRQPPAQQSMWSRIAASLFVLILLGVAYLTFRGPVVHDSGDGFRAPLLNVTEVDEQEDGKRWDDDAAPIDVARRRGGTIGHKTKSSAETNHRAPTELTAEESSVISSSPTARQESKAGDAGATANVDEVIRSDGEGEDFSSLPLWNGPTNHPVLWGQEAQGATTGGSMSADEPTLSSPPVQRDVTPPPAGSDAQVILGGVVYPSTGYVVQVQPRSVYLNTQNSPAPRIATDPGAMRKRQFDGEAPGFEQGQHSRLSAGDPRLRGTIDNPYTERNYESGRPGLY